MRAAIFSTLGALSFAALAMAAPGGGYFSHSTCLAPGTTTVYITAPQSFSTIYITVPVSISSSDVAIISTTTVKSVATLYSTLTKSIIVASSTIKGVDQSQHITVTETSPITVTQTHASQSTSIAQGGSVASNAAYSFYVNSGMTVWIGATPVQTETDVVIITTVVTVYPINTSDISKTRTGKASTKPAETSPTKATNSSDLTTTVTRKSTISRTLVTTKTNTATAITQSLVSSDQTITITPSISHTFSTTQSNPLTATSVITSSLPSMLTPISEGSGLVFTGTSSGGWNMTSVTRNLSGAVTGPTTALMTTTRTKQTSFETDFSTFDIYGPPHPTVTKSSLAAQSGFYNNSTVKPSFQVSTTASASSTTITSPTGYVPSSVTPPYGNSTSANIGTLGTSSALGVTISSGPYLDNFSGTSTTCLTESSSTRAPTSFSNTSTSSSALVLSSPSNSYPITVSSSHGINSTCLTSPLITGIPTSFSNATISSTALGVSTFVSLVPTPTLSEITGGLTSMDYSATPTFSSVRVTSFSTANANTTCTTFTGQPVASTLSSLSDATGSSTALGYLQSSSHSESATTSSLLVTQDANTIRTTSTTSVLVEISSSVGNSLVTSSALGLSPSSNTSSSGITSTVFAITTSLSPPAITGPTAVSNTEVITLLTSSTQVPTSSFTTSSNTSSSQSQQNSEYTVSSVQLTTFISVTITNLPSTTSSTSAEIPGSCVGHGYQYGDFTLNFDDIPPLSSGAVNPAPVFNPYHQFDFSDGFTVGPPPVTAYHASSPPRLLQFIPFYNAEGSNPNAGPDVVELGYTGQISEADKGATGCFNFNIYGGSFGCNSTGPDCEFTFSGHHYDSSTNIETLVTSQTVCITACPIQKDCTLLPISLNEKFQNLTSVRIDATVQGTPSIWWMDDLRLGWTNNSCKTGVCRLNAHIH